MAVRKLKPSTEGVRGMSVIAFRGVLSGTRPTKSLSRGRNRTDVRNNRGVKTMTGRGGGAKRQWRMVDLAQRKFQVPSLVKSIEYDPNRSGFIAQINFVDGEKRYILAPEGMQVGDKLTSGETAKIKLGNRLQLKNIPAGTSVYNVEMVPGKGGQLARSAGTGIVLMGLDAGFALLRLPSGEVRKVPETCAASIGRVSNPDHMNVRIAKAGRTRHMGHRPTTRGKAMNPVDHPHGGGEGNTSIGLKHGKTKTGKVALGHKTRSKNKFSAKLIVKARTRKRRK
jgi:large subunit ribosomal protein L2